MPIRKTTTTYLTICFVASMLLFTGCQKDEPFDKALVRKMKIHSSYTGSTYPVYVVLPEYYDPEITHKTLYVLDGDDELEGIAVYEQMAWACKNSSAQYSKQNVIVVGVGSLGNDERFRDYAPVPGTIPPKGVGGGSENYSRFFELELIPAIESEFTVDKTAEGRVLAGHSLGGTFTGFMFTKHPEVFSNYLTMSPAFWWGDGATMEYEEETRLINAQRSTLVFISCGEFEEGIRILAWEWSYRMKAYYPHCTTDFHIQRTAGHLSSAKRSITEGVDFYFKKTN